MVKKTLNVDQLYFPWKIPETIIILFWPTQKCTQTLLLPNTFVKQDSFHLGGFYHENVHNISVCAVMLSVSTSFLKHLQCNFLPPKTVLHLILIATHILLVIFCNFFFPWTASGFCLWEQTCQFMWLLSTTCKIPTGNFSIAGALQNMPARLWVEQHESPNLPRSWAPRFYLALRLWGSFTRLSSSGQTQLLS